MSRDRDDVKLGDIDDLNVDEPPRPARAAPGEGRGSGNGKGPGRNPPPKRGGGGWIFATLLLLALLAAVSGYFYLQINTLQARLDNRISQSSQKLGDLQSRLSQSGQSSDQLKKAVDSAQKAVDANSKKLDQEDDQIRKLWDVSNKRNKDDIADNQKAVKDLRGDLAALKRSADRNGDAITKARNEVADLKNQLGGAVKSMKDTTSQQGTQLNQMQTQLDAAIDTLNQLQKQNKSEQAAIDKLRKSQGSAADLDKRLSNVEDAIKAFDKYRLEVNRRLDRLEKEH